MKKKILGLDLGTTSIGWALVEEDQSNKQHSKIVKLGVRVNPLTTDEQTDFEKGRPLSVNADRTLKRGARRNLQRYKLRRKNLLEILSKIGFISKETLLTEIGIATTYQTLFLRAKAAKKQVEKEEFARILLTINKKRGYKSSRKAKNDEEGMLIDGMSVAKELYDKELTPGQFVYQLLNEQKKYIPDFYPSDLKNEFDSIWNFQKQFYAKELTDDLYKELQGKNKTQTWAICKEPFQLVGILQKGKSNEKQLERYKWRTQGLVEKLELEHLAIVLQEINNDVNKSSGYLGAISDRSKELYFNKETVGENLCKQIQKNRHTSLKNQVFYRQDYLDEFEQIWETQARYYPELTVKLKEEIRDVVIFYQRKLKSQKGLLSHCEFESWEETYIEKITGKKKKRIVGQRVLPKSSPLFQEFKIWQNLNNVTFTAKKKVDNTLQEFVLNEEQKQQVFEELNIRGNLKVAEILKIIGESPKEWTSKLKEIEGNRTNESLYNIFKLIVDNEGYGFDWEKKSALEIKTELKTVFSEIGISPKILEFNTETVGDEFDKQASYQFWHLLYASEEDIPLKKKLSSKYGFEPKYANMLTNVSLQQDYGSLSARAIKKILPYLKAGHQYDKACKIVGYNHSNSLTTEERANKPLEKRLEILKKNSLRNPVVEKIINQMVNVVNQVIDTYGPIDEVRIELARELKKSAKERLEMTSNINKAKGRHLEIKKLLQKAPFHIPNPTRNDVIRYKLYEELSGNGYKTLYTDKEIPPYKLFSKEIEVEHIIPKSKLFDDSFSNKTLAYHKPNQDKGDSTAFDFIMTKYSNDLENYKNRVESLFNKGKGSIGKAKRNKLLMSEKEIPDGFIDRDLGDSQYIAKKAKEILEKVVQTVNTTTGSITARLREDWGLINVMQDLNLPKYRTIDENLIEKVEKKDGTFKTRIKDWSKRDDHRHHAMDALTVAFTRHNHVQYLNNLKAKSDKKGAIYGIQEVETYIDKRGRRKFITPILNFREEAKKHIETILISFKAKNKVVTKNSNKIKIKGKDNYKLKVQLTPRGQLHKETVYGKTKEIVVKNEKINGKFDEVKIQQVTKPMYKEALLRRLQEFNNDPKKAFTGKNTLSRNPIYLNIDKTKVVPETVKIQFFEDNYTIRKEISPDLKIEKVVDKGIQKILQKRVEEFNGNAKEAFSNLEKNPIWLDKENRISIKRVRISGVKNVEALHEKKDHLGNLILDVNGKPIPADFVSTGNNHHVAIYRDENGKLQEKVVSFYEAVSRANRELPIVDKDYKHEKGWKFLFTMKQNEMFVFPSEDFNPKEINLLDDKNVLKISPNLFRVQKIATKNYFFRHHLETSVDTIKALKGIAYKPQLGLNSIEGIMKVRVNHLGKIVQVGEY